jgi:GTP cyclohydrolase I
MGVSSNTRPKDSATLMSAVKMVMVKKETQIVNINSSSVQSPCNKNMKHIILLIGDCHIRYCADRTKDNLNKMQRVIGLCKTRDRC